MPADARPPSAAPTRPARAASSVPCAHRSGDMPSSQATCDVGSAQRLGDVGSAQAPMRRRQSLARIGQATCPAPRRSRASARRHAQCLGDRAHGPGDMPSAQATWAAPCAHRPGDMPRRLGDIGTAQRLGPCQATSPYARAQPTSAHAIAYATSAWDIGRCQMLDIYSGLPCDHWHHGTRAPSDAHHNTTPHVPIREPSSRRHALSRKNKKRA